MKFRSDVAGTVTGVRFYKSAANTGTHVGNLWTDGGTLLRSAMFTGESAAGWQQVNFATPVSISANTVYVVSYHTNVGHYGDDQNYFANKGFDAPPLHALQNGVSGSNSVYDYGTGNVFPASTYLSTNYWVDVVFTAAPTPTPATPTPATPTPATPTPATPTPATPTPATPTPATPTPATPTPATPTPATPTPATPTPTAAPGNPGVPTVDLDADVSGPSSAKAGKKFSYTVTVKNKSRSTSSPSPRVTIDWEIGETGLNVLSVPNGCEVDGDAFFGYSVICTRSEALRARKTWKLRFSGKATSTGTTRFDAVVSDSGITDPKSHNNSDGKTTRIRQRSDD